MAKPGRPGVTYDEVAQAADALVAQGKKPTCEAVRHALGRGSNSTVHPLLVRWREINPPAPPPPPQVPGTLLRSLQEELDRAAAEARAEIEERLIEAQSDAKRLAAEGEELEGERDALTDRVALLQVERDQAVTLSDERAAEIVRLTELLSREQAAAESARLELAKCQLRAETDVARLQELGHEIERLRGDMDAERQRREQAERDAAVLGAKIDAEREAREAALERERAAVARADTARSELEAMRIDMERKTEEIREISEKRLAEVQALAEKRIANMAAAAQAREKDIDQKFSAMEKALLEERARSAAAETMRDMREKQVSELQARVERADARFEKVVETYQAFAVSMKPTAPSPSEELLKPSVPPVPPKKRSGAQLQDRQT